MNARGDLTGAIVDISTDPTQVHPFEYSNGRLTQLAVPSSYAAGIEYQ
jgi:hypothetical protein